MVTKKHGTANREETSMLRSIGFVTVLAVLMIACGGGSSGGASSEQSPPPLTTYSIGGTVTGLTGSRLVLQTNTGHFWSARAYVRGDQS